jgi:hypothetical protein
VTEELLFPFLPPPLGKGVVRAAIHGTTKAEAELLAWLLREQHPPWIGRMAAEFIEREHLARRKRGGQRKKDRNYSFRDAHEAVTKRLICRRVHWVQRVLRRAGRRGTLTEAFERVAEELGRDYDTVKKHYYRGLRGG